MFLIAFFLTLAAAGVTGWYVKWVITSGVKEPVYRLKTETRESEKRSDTTSPPGIAVQPG
jgi:hypothetical protein